MFQQGSLSIQSSIITFDSPGLYALHEAYRLLLGNCGEDSHWQTLQVGET